MGKVWLKEETWMLGLSQIHDFELYENAHAYIL